jgi:phosphoribosylglycinamide formyltransferase-1
VRPVIVAVLASGSGTNLEALLADPVVATRIGLVLSDRGDAGSLQRAMRHEVPAIHLDPQEHASREDHDRALLALLRDREVEIVCLAGYMRILSPEVVRAFWGRMLNVHPSLLPAFPGAHAVRDALAWGVKVTGATVHFVDEEIDHGPIALQEAVPVLEGDDEGSLHARIQQAEYRIYPAAVRSLIEGRLRLEGRRVIIDEPVRLP